jgi:hypothetical protein
LSHQYFLLSTLYLRSLDFSANASENQFSTLHDKEGRNSDGDEKKLGTTVDIVKDLKIVLDFDRLASMKRKPIPCAQSVLLFVQAPLSAKDIRQAIDLRVFRSRQRKEVTGILFQTR